MVTKVKELADAEAERVEAEEDEPGTEAPPAPDDATDEEEAADQPTPAPPVEPSPAAISDTEIAQAQKKVAAQRKALAKILGADFVAQECPMCAALGFMPELAPVGTTFTLTEDESGFALDVQAPGDVSRFPVARDKEACDWCDAYGFVNTGSRNPQAQIVPCSRCNGNGWVTKAADVPGNGAGVTAALLPFGGEPDATVAGIPDAWGRAPGHQYWGVPPEQVKG